MEENESDSVYKKYQFLLFDTSPKAEDIYLDELGSIVQHFEHFLSSEITTVKKPADVIPKLAELIVSFGIVKSFEGSEDRDFDAKDFPFEADNAIWCFQYISKLLVYYESLDTSSKRKFLIQALLLSAVHSKKYLWSNDASVSASENFLTSLLLCTKHSSLSALLCDDAFHPTIFKAILKWLRPSLMKDTWMKNPSSCPVFYWLLSHVKHPHLADYLPDIIPPSFMFTSYHSVPQIVIGIKCFDHILDNVPPTLIKADGTGDAIFDILKRNLHHREFPIVEIIYPCFLKLPMMDMRKADHSRWLEFDVILDQLLQNIRMESDPKLCCLFLSQTLTFLKVFPCFKHLKKALDVMYINLTADSTEDEECRYYALQIIKVLLQSCWPRTGKHCSKIMLAVLKVICDIEMQENGDENSSSEVLNLCEECLYLIKASCPLEFKVLTNEYLEGGNSLPGCEQLENLLVSCHDSIT